MSDYSTTETEMDNDELTEQLAIITNLKTANESITKELSKLKHDSEIAINDLNIQMEILQKKNKSLNEYNEALKNSNSSNPEFMPNPELEKQSTTHLENRISDLESEKNLIVNGKMDLERQVNNLLIENSNLKLENNKLTVGSTKLKALLAETSKDTDLLDKSQYEGLAPQALELIMEKDLLLSGWEAKFEDFQRQAIELITDECNKNFQELKILQEANNQLSDKLRETQNELLAKIKEYEALAKDQNEHTSKNLNNMQKRVSNLRRLSNLHSGLNANNNNNFGNRKSTLLNNNGRIIESPSEFDAEVEGGVGDGEYETQSFNTEEVQVLVENYKELESKHRDLESEYEQKSKFWEFEMERLQNHFSDAEFSLKHRVEDMSRMNDILRKEISEYEAQQLRASRNSTETDTFMLLEIDSLKSMNDELIEQKEKMDFNYRDKISNLNKEIKEADEVKNSLLVEKERLLKELEKQQGASAKKEKEIQEKNRIELNYKENEINELKSKFQSMVKEAEIYKKDLVLAKNNHEKLSVSYENLTKNYEKVNQSNKNEIERLKEEKDKIKNKKEFEITQLKKQAAELREKLTEKENFIAVNMNSLSATNGGVENGETCAAALSDVLEENEADKQIESLKALISAKEVEINQLAFNIEEFKRKVNEKEKLEIELEHAKAEVAQQKTNLKSQKDMYEKQIFQLQQNNLNINADLLSHKRRTTSIKTEGTLNSKQLVIFAEMDTCIKKLTGENKYLKDQLEILQSEVEKIKILKETDVNYLKQELLHAEKAAIEAKIAVATLAFDKDCEIVKYKNMYKKLRMKVQVAPPGVITATNKNTLQKK